jgi:hypothetical protein
MQNKNIVISVIVCVVVAGISFWGGMKYDASKNVINQMTNRGGQGGFNQNGGIKNQGMRGGINGGAVLGEILSVDSTSMTIKLRDGGSKIVLFSPSSKVEKTVDGTTSDVVVGKTVMVTGTANPDGSVSATSIQMRPAFPVVPSQPKTN